MKVKDLNRYNEWKEKNRDDYGACIFRYAERWANLMEQQLEQGAKLEDIAEKLSHEADVEGITGFMYGAAVAVLAKCWEYGEELRQWHNKRYGYEGNGVVNPAVITINAKEEP